MITLKIFRRNRTPQSGLYCVWIRAHGGENAPLVQVWIDSSMTMFEASVERQTSRLLTVKSESGATLAGESEQRT